MKLTFQIGKPESDAHILAHGFHVPREMQGRLCRICDKEFGLAIPFSEGSVLLTLSLFNGAPDAVSQELTVLLDGKQLTTITLKELSWHDYAIEVPATTSTSRALLFRCAIDPNRQPTHPVLLCGVSMEGEGHVNEALLRPRIEVHPIRMTSMLRPYHEIRKNAPVYGGMDSKKYSYSSDKHIYFGDVHVHTNHSKCGFPNNRSIEENAAVAVERGHDFIAFTDHGEHMSEEDWKQYFAEIRAAQQTFPQLTVIPAIEWTSYSHGHRNIYYKTTELPFHNSNTFETNHPGKLRPYYDALGVEAFCAAHHPCYLEHLANFAVSDPEFEPLVEIYSTWGSSERYRAELQHERDVIPGASVQDALAAGHKFGFIGGGDVHNTLPGDGGLTAIIASGKDLPTLWQAMKDRSCYAVANDRIMLDFHINGYPMGSRLTFNQFTVDKLFPLNVAASVVCPDAVDRLELVANGEVICSKNHRECKTEIDFFHRIRKMESPGGRHNTGASHDVNFSRCYYIRAVQKNGCIAWSSPIWLDFEWA